MDPALHIQNVLDDNNTRDDYIAATAISAVCIIGSVMLSFVIYGCFRIKAMKSPFGLLLLNQNIAQLVACINSFLFYFIGVFLRARWFVTNSKFFGAFIMFLLPVILFSYLLISINRFTALAFPLSYEKRFSKKKMAYMIIIVWVGSFISAVYSFFIRDCSYVFYQYGWVFSYDTPNKNCNSWHVISLFYFQVVMTFLITLIDIFTFILLLCSKSQFHNSQKSEIKKKERSFVKQVLIQGFVFILHGFWYEYGSGWIPGDEKWKFFITASLTSNLLHIFDPLIVFVCNREFRNWICPSLGKKQSTVDVAISVTNQLNTRF